MGQKAGAFVTHTACRALASFGFLAGRNFRGCAPQGGRHSTLPDVQSQWCACDGTHVAPMYMCDLIAGQYYASYEPNNQVRESTTCPGAAELACAQLGLICVGVCAGISEAIESPLFTEAGDFVKRCDPFFLVLAHRSLLALAFVAGSKR